MFSWVYFSLIQEFVLAQSEMMEKMAKLEQWEEEAENKWAENWKNSVAHVKRLFSPF